LTTSRHRLRTDPDAAGVRLDVWLAGRLPELSRARLQALVADGHVLLEGAPARSSTRLKPGQSVVVSVPPPVAAAPAPEDIPLQVVHQDAQLLVVDKPAGLVVHPGAGNATGTLENGLLAHDPRLAGLPRSGILHRLDKDTSGLLIVAKTPVAHTHLVRALEAREIMREYRALCVGPMTAGGSVEADIGRHRTQRTKMSVTDSGGRHAVTHYRVLARFPHHTFVAVRLETGRTHQIRVHLAHVRHPLVGDPAYGGRLIIPAGASPQLALALRGFRRQALHAFRIRFSHPLSGELLDLSAPLPADFRGLLAALAGDAAAVPRLEALAWPEQAPA
jgi:23S rRNA pseudouridine1911/1915/1917 synthase